MLYQCSCRSLVTISKSPRVLKAARKLHRTSLTRTYTSLPMLRPTIFLSSSRASPLQSSASLLSSNPGSHPSHDRPLDLASKISSHPALGSTQVRCGPRNTFSPSHFVRKRRHGFLSRQKTRKGRATLVRRRLKRRSTLSH